MGSDPGPTFKSVSLTAMPYVAIATQGTTRELFEHSISLFQAGKCRAWYRPPPDKELSSSFH